MDLNRSRNSVLLAGFLCCFLLHLAPFSLATDHIVGANRGWQPPANAGESAHLNYTEWAKAQKFYIGDEVSFHYPESMQYTVFQVNFSVYTNCTINMYSGHDWIYNWTSKSGRTVVPLNQTMVYYFVDASNCNNGMKVAINVTTNTTTTTTGVNKSSSKKSSSQASPNTLTFSTLLLAQAFLFLSVWLLYPTL